MYFHDSPQYQATPAARARLTKRGYTRDAIPTIDDGVHVHVHTHDQEPDESADLLDRIDRLEHAVAYLVTEEGEEGLPDDDVVEPGLTSGMRARANRAPSTNRCLMTMPDPALRTGASRASQRSLRRRAGCPRPGGGECQELRVLAARARESI
jgi:sirohydrochlorin ferrochelatase